VGAIYTVCAWLLFFARASQHAVATKPARGCKDTLESL
jgi:hypothetical protein